MSEPRGAGMGGGLLFLAVVLFLGYLAITTLIGVLKWVAGLAFLVVVVGLVMKVVNRR